MDSSFSLRAGVLALALLAVVSNYSRAAVVERNPTQGAGFVDVDNFDFFGVRAGTPFEVDVVFTDMQHIELLVQGATTNIEFGIGNTTNDVDLNFEITFDLSDELGNLITQDALFVAGTAQAGFIQAINLDLTPLPPVIFHDFHIFVKTEFVEPADGLFDLRVAGGGGVPGTIVSGPIRFNRAVVGDWGVPEPTTFAVWSLLGACVTGVGLRRRSRAA